MAYGITKFQHIFVSDLGSVHRHTHHPLSSPLHHAHPYSQAGMRYDGSHDAALNVAAVAAGYGLVGASAAAAARYSAQFPSTAFGDGYHQHHSLSPESSVSTKTK